jgi:ribonuclease VapC
VILDTSSIITVAAREPGFRVYAEAMSRADLCRVSAATFVELSIVMERQFDAKIAQQCDTLLRDIGVVIEPVTVEQAYLARQAFHDFGRGRHEAGLNFGDCFAYALAKSTGEPLLFKGDDFRNTDVLPAL